MASVPQTTPSTERRPSAESIPISRTLEWVIAIGMLLIGGVFLALGTMLAQFADVDRIATWIAEGTITSTELTDPELIDTTYALIWGGGVGLALTGGIIILGGLVFLGVQTRARRGAGYAIPSRTGTAILGSLVTLVAWFVPFSPILGGGVAGYVGGGARRTAIVTGGLAGLFASVPVLIVSAAVVWALAVDSTAGVSLFVGFMLTFSLFLGFAYMVGLSALGAYLGNSLGASRELD